MCKRCYLLLLVRSHRIASHRWCSLVGNYCYPSGGITTINKLRWEQQRVWRRRRNSFHIIIMKGRGMGKRGSGKCSNEPETAISRKKKEKEKVEGRKMKGKRWCANSTDCHLQSRVGRAQVSSGSSIVIVNQQQQQSTANACRHCINAW